MTEPTVIIAVAAPHKITIWLAVNEVGDSRISWDSAADAISELQENDGAEAVRVIELNVTVDLPVAEIINVAVEVPPETHIPAQVIVS